MCPGLETFAGLKENKVLERRKNGALLLQVRHLENAQLAMTLRASCIASPVSSFLVDMSIFNVCMANGHVRVGRRGGPGSWSQVRGQGDP